MRTGTGREERTAPVQLRVTTSYCPALAPIETSSPPLPSDWRKTGGANAHSPTIVRPRVLLNNLTLGSLLLVADMVPPTLARWEIVVDGAHSASAKGHAHGGRIKARNANEGVSTLVRGDDRVDSLKTVLISDRPS